MSNHHAARAQPPEAQRPRKSKPVLYIALPVTIAFVLAIPFIHHLWTQDFDAGWLRCQAEVLETRIAIIGSQDHYRSGEIDYRVEAHVRYLSNGVTHDAWLPTSKISDGKLFLEFWVSQHSRTSGLVLQNPRNPEDMVVVLD